jgi:ABC-type uncharacterized transport system substrate-binding protein
MPQQGLFSRQYRTQIVTLAAQQQLPAIYDLKAFVAAGGLLAYGPRLEERIRRVTGFVDQILHGAKLADLPVEQPTTFKLVINRASREGWGVQRESVPSGKEPEPRKLDGRGEGNRASGAHRRSHHRGGA